MVDWLYDPEDVGLGDLDDVDASDMTAGLVPTRQADGTFAMEAGGSDSQAGLVVGGIHNADGDLVFPYGIDTTDTPYFDSDGAVSGQEAVVSIDPSDGVVYIEGAGL